MNRSLLFLVLLLSPYAWGTMYQTSFPDAENPLSESGNWINGKAVGVNWSDCRSNPGEAYGTQPNGPYNDSTCVLFGNWGATQTAQATVKLSGSTSGPMEVELRLHTTIAAKSITGYEINCSVIPGSPYMQIVRWNGPLGSWTQLGGADVGCSNGDVIKATISGSTITAYKNGAQTMQVSDSTFQGGAPGMGFYVDNGGVSLQANFGFSSFSADDGTVTSTPPPTTPPPTTPPPTTPPPTTPPPTTPPPTTPPPTTNPSPWRTGRHRWGR